MQQVVPGIVEKCNKMLSCEIHAKAKQTRLEFPDSNTHSEESFDKINVDLWGPYHKTLLYGAHYVPIIVDDHSRATWTFLVAN